MPLDDYSKLKFAQRIKKWYDAGHLLGPFRPTDPIVADVRETPVFTVDRADGGKRPVSDASRRLDDGGPSVNEHIKEFAPEKATVEYLRLQQILATIWLAALVLGHNVQIWAKDLDEGYYNMRIRRDQIRLTAFFFCGLWFLPMTLAMGLTSAPHIFTVFMGYVVAAMLFSDRQLNYLTVDNAVIEPFRHHFPDGVIEAVSSSTSRIPLILFYLDDMFGIQRAGRWIRRQFEGAQKVLLSLALNAQPKKDRRPASYNLILGIGVHCGRRHVRVWKEKGEKYIAFSFWLLSQHTLEKRRLFSLSGKARHIAVHIPVLAAFARGLEVFGHKDRNGRSIGWRHRIQWTNGLRHAILLLAMAIRRAMDIPVPFERILRPRSFDAAEVRLYTDAAGVHGGIGGFTMRDGATFFQVDWSAVSLAPHHDIMWKEMVAVWVALRLNVDLCRGRHIACVCDNQSVVAMLFRYRAPIERPDLFWLILQVAALCLDNDIWPYYHWISSAENVTADRLSRFHDKPFEHCAVEGLTATNEAALQLLCVAVQRTHHFSINIEDCCFDDDDDDDSPDIQVSRRN